MATILYSNDTSYYSMIARLVLAEKSVAYELHSVDIQIKLEQFTPEYVKIQPNMTVPTLVSDSATLVNSKDILFFVNKYFPGENLFPDEDAAAIEDLVELHYSYSIEDLTMGTLIRKSPVARKMFAHGLKRATRRCLQLLSTHPEFKSICEKKLLQEKDRERLILSEKNNYIKVMNQASDFCEMLDARLDRNKFIASNSYSLADVVWTVFLARLFMIKRDDLILRHKNVHDYWLRMSARPSYQKANMCTKMPISKVLRMLLTLFAR